MTASSPSRVRRRIGVAIATLSLTGGAVAASSAPALAASAPASSLQSGRYIVTFADEPAASYEGGIAGYPRTRPDDGKKLDPTRDVVVRYRSRLTGIHDRVLSAVGATKLYDYTVATNGVAAQLTSAQAQRLARTAGVAGLEKDALRTTDTSYSPEYLGLSGQGGLWSTLGGDETAGDGVIVGVIDSGIWPESPSFAGSTRTRNKAGQPVPTEGINSREWHGACVQGEQFSSQNCNDKLIGARYYVSGFGKQNLAKDEYLSPRDGEGHGSHTASTAAGNRVPGVTIDGTPQGTVSGMAPGAQVAAYKVCWEAKPGASGGCFNSDSVAAVDDAVADGVDVINYSIGGTSEASALESVEQAFRRAANANVFVAASAGNSGAGASTLDHPSPWLTTVAASTFRNSSKVVELGNGQRYVGASTTPTLEKQTPLVTSVAAKLAGADTTEASLCYPGTLDPAKTAGKVVQCDRGVIARIDKSFEVKRAGGVGMILTNKAPLGLNGDFHAVPTVHLESTARQAVLDYAATAGATAAIVPLDATKGEKAPATPQIVAFSSRGPSTTTGGDILKPDISAPGVDVLAAVAPPFNHGRSYDFLSGTSMSSPHIAGLAALVRASHRTWSVTAVKSALMTTSKDNVSAQGVTGDRAVTPFDQGAGFVQPVKAVDPGLVFGSKLAEVAMQWRQWMVGQGVTFSSFPGLTPISGSEIDQASLAVGSMPGVAVLHRTVTNVGTAAETYTASSTAPGVTVQVAGLGSAIAVGETRALTITVTRTTAALGEYTTGHVALSGSAGHTVRVPLAVRPVAIAAPAEVTGKVTDTTVSWSVTPGTTGTITPAVNGLVGATPTAATITTGALTSPTAPNASNQVYKVTVPAGTSLARFDVDDATNNDDLDLFVYGPDGKLAGQSASASGDETVTLLAPAAGDYTALVNGYDTGGGGGYAFTSWSVPGGPAGNLSVPAVAGTQGQPVTLTGTLSGLDTTKRYLGWVGYGTDERTIVSLK